VEDSLVERGIENGDGMTIMAKMRQAKTFEIGEELDTRFSFVRGN
jgi:hypothetical protein